MQSGFITALTWTGLISRLAHTTHRTLDFNERHHATEPTLFWRKCVISSLIDNATTSLPARSRQR